MGRTGSLWAYQQYGVEPDVMTLAKALGGGLPIGATLMTQRVADAVEPGDHAATFGANPVVANVALAVLGKITADGFIEGVASRGQRLRTGLEKLQQRWPERITELRGRGLIQAAVVTDRPGADYLADFREREILVAPCGADMVRLPAAADRRRGPHRPGHRRLRRDPAAELVPPRRSCPVPRRHGAAGSPGPRPG